MSRGNPDTTPWRGVLSGLCATLIGIGLARFAYTPLIPALIAARWFSAHEAVYLGAANLAGYLGGALLARPLAARAGALRTLRVGMAVATAAFFACAAPLSFVWFFGWRLSAGVAGGVVMVLGAPTVLPHVPPGRRGLAGGVIFTGVGLGIAASGTLVPLLMRVGLVETWCGLGTLALGLTVLAWRGWPEPATGAPAPRAHLPSRWQADRRGAGFRAPWSTPALMALYSEYALNAVGLVPHMVFLVDFVARGLGQGLDGGARYWVIFGLAATAGPSLTGIIADRLGFRTALQLAFVLQAAAVAVPSFWSDPASLAVSSAIVGAFVPGVVPLVLGRVQDLVPADGEARQAAWGLATAAFALGQAGAAYGFSFLFARTGGYAPLFQLGAAALVLGLVIDLAASGAASATSVRPGERIPS